MRYGCPHLARVVLEIQSAADVDDVAAKKFPSGALNRRWGMPNHKAIWWSTSVGLEDPCGSALQVETWLRGRRDHVHLCRGILPKPPVRDGVGAKGTFGTVKTAHGRSAPYQCHGPSLAGVTSKASFDISTLDPSSSDTHSLASLRPQPSQKPKKIAMEVAQRSSASALTNAPPVGVLRISQVATYIYQR